MEGLFGLAFVVFLLIGLFVVLFSFAKRSEAKESYRQARQAYLDSLEKLKRDPQNPDSREKTLELGRQCAAKATLCLQNGIGGVESFDEVALMNDINAACARAGGKVTPGEDKVKPSVEERLVKLDELRSK